MPLEMNREVFITCAITGSGGTQDRSPLVPRSPRQIADAAIDAAKAGAAIVHCHVRDPETGKPRRDVHLYREVTERIRDGLVRRTFRNRSLHERPDVELPPPHHVCEVFERVQHFIGVRPVHRQ